LIGLLQTALEGLEWEVIFVDDDSPDGTQPIIQSAAERDCRIRYIRRIHRRGLAGAAIEGMLSTPARYIAVMDGDMQHDEKLLPSMLSELRDRNIDLVIGTRKQVRQPSGFSTVRAWVSRTCNQAVRGLLGVAVQDPMSGFFMLRRNVIDDVARSLSTDGFKILLDILVCSRGRLRVSEKYYLFRPRISGESKLDVRVAFDFIALVLEKITGGALTQRFLLFCIVGLTGLFVHMLSLASSWKLFGFDFLLAQTVATVTAIAWNYCINNIVTYRDGRRVGWRFVSGLIAFEMICGMGAVSNIGIAYLLYSSDRRWWLAGLCGALIGAVWNYVVSSALIWRR
jgi:dolichol-phosphate mannosyltransferase